MGEAAARAGAGRASKRPPRQSTITRLRARFIAATGWAARSPWEEAAAPAARQTPAKVEAMASEASKISERPAWLPAGRRPAFAAGRAGRAGAPRPPRGPQ